MMGTKSLSKRLSKTLCAGLFGIGLSSMACAKFVVNSDADLNLADPNVKLTQTQSGGPGTPPKGDGKCTLREALENLDDLFQQQKSTYPDCPFVPAGYPSVIDLDLPAGSVITIAEKNYPFMTSSPLILKGPHVKDRKSLVAISGGYRSGVLKSSAGVGITVEEVAIIRGYQETGTGGGVFMDSAESTFRCNRCSIEFNEAETGDGGGIYSSGHVILDDTDMGGNTAQVGGGVSTAYLTATNSYFRNNISQLGGGAVHLRGPTNNPSQIKNSRFSDNVAGGFKTTDGREGLGGGALLVEGKLEIELSDFSFNRYGGGKFYLENDFNGNTFRKGGGAIHITSKGTDPVDRYYITITDSTFSKNQAGEMTEGGPMAGCGGAILIEGQAWIGETSITENASWCSDGGGGIYAAGFDGFINLGNTQLRKNASVSTTLNFPAFIKNADGTYGYDYEGKFGKPAAGPGACLTTEGKMVNAYNITCQGNYGKYELHAFNLVEEGAKFRNSLVSSLNSNTSNCTPTPTSQYNFKGEVDANGNIIEPFLNIQNNSANNCPDATVVNKLSFLSNTFSGLNGEKIGTKDTSGPRQFEYFYPVPGTPGSTGASANVCVGPEVLGKDLVNNPRFNCSFGAVDSK